MYELILRNELSIIHPLFHASTLKKCIGDPIPILPLEDLGVKKDVSYDLGDVS